MTSASPQATTRRTSSRSQMLGFMIFGLAITALVMVYLTFAFGLVEGEEFSPDNFSRRQFKYYRLPLIGLQISPISRTDRTSDLERHLTSTSLVSEIKTTDQQRRWDLVEAMSGVPPTRKIFAQGEARILCSYLDAGGDGKTVWLDWSKKHPELAKIVWPTIAKLARQELYVFVPDLLVIARGATDAVNFQQQLDGLLAEKYCDLASIQQQLGRHDAAVELFTEAISHAPQMAEAFSGRASSLSSLGQTDRASADLAQAKKFDARR